MRFFNRFFYEGDDGAPSGGGEATPAPSLTAPTESVSTPSGGEGTPTPQTAPTAPTATSDSVPLVNPDGTFKENWWENYDSLKEDGSMLKNQSSLETLAKSFANTKRMVGKNLKPWETMTPEEQQEYYKEALKVPEKAEDYNFEKPENFPSDREYDDTHDKWFANICKEHNVPMDVAHAIRKEFFELQNNAQQSASQEMQKVIKEQRDELVKDWGAEDSASWKANLDQANKAIKAFSEVSGRDVAGDIASIGLDNNPILFRLLSQIGANVGEKELAGIGTGDLSMTKEQAQSEINKINANKDALFNKNHPEHDALIKRRSELRSIVHPGVYAEL